MVQYCTKCTIRLQHGNYYYCNICVEDLGSWQKYKPWSEAKYLKDPALNLLSVTKILEDMNKRTFNLTHEVVVCKYCNDTYRPYKECSYNVCGTIEIEYSKVSWKCYWCDKRQTSTKNTQQKKSNSKVICYESCPKCHDKKICSECYPSCDDCRKCRFCLEKTDLAVYVTAETRCTKPECTNKFEKFKKGKCYHSNKTFIGTTEICRICLSNKCANCGKKEKFKIVPEKNLFVSYDKANYIFLCSDCCPTKSKKIEISPYFGVLGEYSIFNIFDSDNTNKWLSWVDPTRNKSYLKTLEQATIFSVYDMNTENDN